MYFVCLYFYPLNYFIFTVDIYKYADLFRKLYSLVHVYTIGYSRCLGNLARVDSILISILPVNYEYCLFFQKLSCNPKF